MCHNPRPALGFTQAPSLAHGAGLTDLFGPSKESGTGGYVNFGEGRQAGQVACATFSALG